MSLAKISICLLMLFSIIACDRKGQNEMQTPQFVFSYAENQTKDYPTTLGAYQFATLVEERTKGRIKILVQPEGKLGSEKQVLEQLQFGGVDFSRVSLSQLAEVVPEFNVLQMPFLYKDSTHMWKVLDGSVGEKFLQATEGYDMVAISWYDAGARNFYNAARPICSLEDIQGLKIRVQESELMTDVIRALGAIPVPIVYSEVYSSLERGIVDGAENNWPSYEAMSHYEVAKYYTIDEHTRVPEIQLCAQATWDKLSSEDQEIIRLCAQESALYERELWIEREKQSKEIALEKDVQIIVLSPEERLRFQVAVEGVYEKYCAQYMDIIHTIKQMEE